MDVRKERFLWVPLLVIVLMIGLVSLNGCKKSEPASSEDHTGHEHAMAEVADIETAVAKTIEQTTCPVMGGKIDKDIFVEYKGQKVYLCCAMCEGKFKADPEKYISKLPQFQK